MSKLPSLKRIGQEWALINLKRDLKYNLMEEQLAYRDIRDAEKRVKKYSDSHNRLCSEIHALEIAIKNS